MNAHDTFRPSLPLGRHQVDGCPDTAPQHDDANAPLDAAIIENARDIVEARHRLAVDHDHDIPRQQSCLISRQARLQHYDPYATGLREPGRVAQPLEQVHLLAGRTAGATVSTADVDGSSGK